MNRTILWLIATPLILSFSIEASAGELLKCEKRSRPARSKISVAVEDLTPGAIYTAIVSSGNNSALKSEAADVVGVVELDFDSNPKDIAAGATAISSQFIAGQVSVLITDALGNKVSQATVACRTR